MVIAQLKAFCRAAPTLTLHLEGKDGHGRCWKVLVSSKNTMINSLILWNLGDDEMWVATEHD